MREGWSDRRVVIAVAAGMVLGAGGCHVTTGGSGHGDDVKIATPFGGLQVRTDDAVASGVGLPVYPGAELTRKEDGKDKDAGAADVTLSFGNFHLRVKALRYRSGDDAEKVKAFYAKALGRYGDVIECVSGRPVGPRQKTAEGLTCDKGEREGAAEGDAFSHDLELKAGSEQHQHLVPISRDGSGTKFALVALDLPSKHAGEDSGERPE